MDLADFVENLPNGILTWVGENGVLLSGGQARRLALARALLKNAPVMILDEPTEGLDSATEATVMRALRPKLAGRTVLLITHRESLVKEHRSGLADRRRLTVASTCRLFRPPPSAASCVDLGASIQVRSAPHAHAIGNPHSGRSALLPRRRRRFRRRRRSNPTIS